MQKCTCANEEYKRSINFTMVSFDLREFSYQVHTTSGVGVGVGVGFVVGVGVGMSIEC